tara:strand:+ start:10897 stop:11979 length:1083 start_codon:yes stop_codon:yes gene_type:complete
MKFKLYETLGLNRNDDPSQQEIKKAYHKKALKHHPDKNPNNKDNEILFKEISNAYTILSDENKKRSYDNLGDDNYQEGNQNDMNPEDIFQHFFGNNNNPFGGPFSSSFNFDFNRKQNKKCSNITKMINATLEDVYNGIDSTMKINVKNNCLNCIKICNECDGRGVTQILRNLGLMQQIIQKTCDKCRGKGEIIELNKSCKKCNGEGTYINEHNANLKISAGFPNNYKTSFKGLGEQPKSKNEIPGDLIIQVNVSENKYFKRDINNLYYTYNINYLDSILGKNIEIPYFNENIKLNTKSYGIILHKNEYTIKNKGLPIFNKENNYGNLIIKFEINPVKLKENINENDINSFKEHFNKLIIN